MTITLEGIEALKAKMQEAPEVEKSRREISKQDAVKELRAEIEAMQKRGYTLEDIADFMSKGGVQITTATLKSYLQRTKPARKAKPKAAKAENFADAKKDDQANQQKPKEEPKAAPVQQPIQNKPAGTQGNIPKGGFEIKPDTDI